MSRRTKPRVIATVEFPKGQVTVAVDSIQAVRLEGEWVMVTAGDTFDIQYENQALAMIAYAKWRRALETGEWV